MLFIIYEEMRRGPVHDQTSVSGKSLTSNECRPRGLGASAATTGAISLRSLGHGGSDQLVPHQLQHRFDLLHWARPRLKAKDLDRRPGRAAVRPQSRGIQGVGEPPRFSYPVRPKPVDHDAGAGRVFEPAGGAAGHGSRLRRDAFKTPAPHAHPVRASARASSSLGSAFRP